MKTYFRLIATAVLATTLRLNLLGQSELPHVVFIAGEAEYAAHWTLPKIADDLQRRFNIRTSVIHSWRSGAHDYDMPGEVEIPEYEEIENLEMILDADLIVMHIRFRIPPPEQYDIFQEYFDSGKPAIAFRTTSHGFWPADKKDWFVPFFGGHYKGHMPNSDGTTTIVPAEQLDHPILRGVPKMKNWNDIMGVYITAPLNDSAIPLMMGKTGPEGPAQPVTWINEYQEGQKIFYTSLGGLESFVDPGFINMVYNTVYWALDREVPSNGVLGIDDLDAYESEPPFERYGFGLLNENPFEKPEELLEPENRMVFNEKYVSVGDIPPAPKRKIPRKAITIFDGTDLSNFRHWDVSDKPIAMLPDARAVSPSPVFNSARWKLIGNAIEARPGYGSVLTREQFGNYKLHFDFLIPSEPNYVPEKYKGSGGVWLNGQYEIKIMDSHGGQPSPTSNGSIYNQISPTSNPSKPVNTWQSMDIEYRHYEGELPDVSVILNGEKIHDNVQIMNRSAFSIREDMALFQSTEEQASGAMNLNKDDWSINLRFRTLRGGYLFSNSPKNKPWNENSKGFMLYEGLLVSRFGESYHMYGEETNLSDGNWHTILVSSSEGKIDVYVDDVLKSTIENSGDLAYDDHVFRLGQGPKRFRLGASELPEPYNGETFNGEIGSFKFFNKPMSLEEMQDSKSSIFQWPNESSEKKPVMGPIRFQTDLSKIRYANIWLEPIESK